MVPNEGPVRPKPGTSASVFPRATELSLFPQPTMSSTSGDAPLPPSTTGSNEYAGWKPQPITQQTSPAPLSPVDLAMYPGAPPETDPVAARKAVAGLKPLRILRSKRSNGSVRAGPSRPSSVDAGTVSDNASKFGLMGWLSVAKRASGVVPSASSSSRTSAHSSVSHTPIPVSPLPPARTPPLVPSLALAPHLGSQLEPEFAAHLESLAAQASSQLLRHTTEAQPAPMEEEEFVLEIRDLDSGQVISIRNLDAERESQSSSQRPPSISDFPVVRDLDAQPRTPPPPPLPPPLQPITPGSSPPKYLSPILLLSDLHQPGQISPVTPCTEAERLNRGLEATLSDLERALGYPTSSRSRSGSIVSSHVRTPRTEGTTTSSIFSTRTLATPLTTPPASPRPFSATKRRVDLPCMVCSRPMQNSTSTRCGHVFCRGCVEGRTVCPICRETVRDHDLRAIYLFV